jgi:hypothetical protein
VKDAPKREREMRKNGPAVSKPNHGQSHGVA